MSLVVDESGEPTSRWVLLDRVLVRADDVTDDGRTVRVRARIGSAEALAALEALRPGVVRRPERRVTWDGTSAAGRQTTVEVEENGTGWQVEVSVQRPTQAGWRELPGSIVTTTTGTYGRDERAQRSLRRILLGEPMPREPFGMSESLPDFTGDLPGDEVSHEAFAAAFRLLVTEALVASGTARRVTAAEVSQPEAGGRRVHVAWVSAVQTKGDPATLTVSGVWRSR